jgi:hypothetical protein
MTARERQQELQVAECLLPGLTLPIAEELGQRVIAELAGRPSTGVAFLGSLLMPGDEVLLCLFSGPQADVRAVSERAGLPFERILACVGVGWRPEREETVNEPGPRGRAALGLGGAPGLRQ